MSHMGRLGHSRTFIGPMLLLLLMTFGCSRPTPTVPSEDSSQTYQTPFQGPDRPGDGTAQTAALIERTNPDSDFPFRNSSMIPAGSLLTVRLKRGIAAVEHGSSGTFEAVVDEPVVLEGSTMIPRGTIVSGRVGAVHISNLKPDRGYVRLGLESVNLDGLDLPLQSATLFARQISGDIRPGMIRLEKGRRLTFRLSEPFYPGAQHASAVH
jgi:hypothetical protein